LKRKKRRTFENREERNRTEIKKQREKENRERGVNELKQEEEDLFEIQRRESENRRGEGKTETAVSAQRRRRTVPHHLGTTAVLPLHCHNSTVILPTSTLPTPAEPEREKRNMTEQRGKKKKQRPRALHRGGEERQSRHRLESSSFLLPDTAPTTFHYRQTINGEEQNKREGGAEIAEGSKKKKKTVTAALPPGITPDCHRKPLSAQLPEHFHFR